MSGRAPRGVRSDAHGASMQAAAAEMATAAGLAVHRVSLARTVRQASPLLLDALAARGAVLGDVLDRLADPPAGWLARHTGHRLARPTLYVRLHPRSPSPRLAGEPSAPLTLAHGEDLHLVWSGSRLGLRGSAGRLRIATVGATAWLGLDDRLPETLAIAVVGRPVDALLDQWLLSGRGYEVLRVEPDTRGFGGTLLQVRTGLRRCRAPWTPAEALESGCADLETLLAAARP